MTDVNGTRVPPPAHLPGGGRLRGDIAPSSVLLPMPGPETCRHVSRGLGLDDLRRAGRAELGGLLKGLRRTGDGLRGVRRSWTSADLGWRLTGVTATALLGGLIDSAVTRAIAQAAVIAAVTIAPTWNRAGFTEPAPPRGAARPADSAGGSRSVRALPGSAPLRDGVHGSAQGVEDGRPAVPPEALDLVPPGAGTGLVVLCRVIPTATQFLVVVTVVDLPGRR